MWQFAHYNGREIVSDITSTLQDKQETTAQMQATVISDISSKQLLPVQRQTAVTAYLKSEQLLWAFFSRQISSRVRRSSARDSMADGNLPRTR